jgi:hypothetical protein
MKKLGHIDDMYFFASIYFLSIYLPIYPSNIIYLFSDRQKNDGDQDYL